jgi:3-hydroxybutyryl-CoA dehydrogenase
MGSGIAEVFARGGWSVIGIEEQPDALDRARQRLSTSTGRAVARGKLAATEAEALTARVQLSTDWAALAGCDVVVEAVPEVLELKRAVFARLDAVVGPDALLATNTSALSVTALAAGTSEPGRVVGLHFFNPAPVLKLVEVVRTELAAEEPYERAYAFAARLGKEPVRCSDTPGFIVNRILIPLLNDCVRVLDGAGVSPEDLDKAMRFGAGWPIGPCALVDLIGVDIHVHASEALHGALGEPRLAPPDRLVRMAEEGHLGRKTGQGFFTYEQG